jgi:hypothetical protein
MLRRSVCGTVKLSWNERGVLGRHLKRSESGHRLRRPGGDSMEEGAYEPAFSY